jgi:hypothetical protein
LENYELQ